MSAWHNNTAKSLSFQFYPSIESSWGLLSHGVKDKDYLRAMIHAIWVTIQPSQEPDLPVPIEVDGLQYKRQKTPNLYKYVDIYR